MKKRLLFALMAVCTSLSSFALEVGEYVYTPQGRFKITSATDVMNGAGAFTSLTGWTTTGSNELADVFTVVNDSTMQYAQSLVNSIGEGMSYTISTLDASATYVVSFKLKNNAETAPAIPLTTASAQYGTAQAGANVVAITGTTGDSASVTTTYSRGAEITQDWVTYSYAIVGDGTARTFTISLTAMNTDVLIADMTIQQAVQVADDREAKDKAAYILSLYNLTDWSKYDDEALDIWPAEKLIVAYGQVADITDDMKAYMLEAYSEDEIASMCPGFTEDYDTYTSQMETYNTEYSKFLAQQMTAYIDVTAETGAHLGYQAGYNLQKQTVIGTWTVVSPSGRGFWRQGWVDLGHFGGGNELTTAELSKEFTLFQGGYTFKADIVGYQMFSTANNNYLVNYGLTSDDGYVYVTNEAGDVVASSESTGIETNIADAWTTKWVTFNVPSDGKYTMHIKTDRRYAGRYGGQVYIRWPELYGKSFGEYSAEELQYVSAVQVQITTGDNNYAEGEALLDSAELAWGKQALKECLDSMATVKQYYDYLFTDTVAIVATYDKDIWTNTVKDSTGLLQYEVYMKYAKDLIAANRTMKAVNDTLAMLSNKIASASELASLSIYSASTGKAALKAEIATASKMYIELSAGEYSEEAAATIVDEIAALQTAMTACMNGISSDYFGTTYADIDFDYTSEMYDNVQDFTEEGGAATIVGETGSMDFTSFRKVTGSGTFSYELGIDADGGFKDLPGVLRVGSSDATVNFNASEVDENLIMISMDWWFVRLSGRYIGFDVLDEDGSSISKIYFSPYDGTINTNTFGGSSLNGFYVGNTTGDAGSCADNNLTHWDVILDYANMQQYIIATTPSGTVYTTPAELSSEVGKPATFKLLCNYANYPARRSWFDNLKIVQVKYNYIPGDVNRDGNVNVADLVAVSNFMAGDTSITKKMADVNGDGDVNVADLVAISNIMAGN